MSLTVQTQKLIFAVLIVIVILRRLEFKFRFQLSKKFGYFDSGDHK